MKRLPRRVCTPSRNSFVYGGRRFGAMVFGWPPAQHGPTGATSAPISATCGTRSPFRSVHACTEPDRLFESPHAR